MDDLKIDVVSNPPCRDYCICDLLNDPFFLGKCWSQDVDFLKRIELIESLLREKRALLQNLGIFGQ